MFTYEWKLGKSGSSNEVGNMKKIVLAVTVAMLASTGAWATQTPTDDYTTSQGKVMTKVTPLMGDDFVKHLGISHYFSYNGPALSDITNPLQPGGENPVSVYSYFTFSYKMKDGISVFAKPAFTFIPVKGESDFSWNDPNIGIQKGELFKLGEVSFFSRFWIGLPLTEKSRLDNKLATPAFALMPQYTFPKSKLSVNAFSMISCTLRSSPAKADESYNNPAGAAIYGITSTDNIGTFVATYPSINYQATETFGINAGIGFEASNKPPSSLFSFTSGSVEASAGVGWDVAKQLSISPSLHFLLEKATAANNYLVVEFSGSLL